MKYDVPVEQMWVDFTRSSLRWDFLSFPWHRGSCLAPIASNWQRGKSWKIYSRVYDGSLDALQQTDHDHSPALLVTFFGHFLTLTQMPHFHQMTFSFSRPSIRTKTSRSTGNGPTRPSGICMPFWPAWSHPVDGSEILLASWVWYLIPIIYKLW